MEVRLHLTVDATVANMADAEAILSNLEEEAAKQNASLEHSEIEDLESMVEEID